MLNILYILLIFVFLIIIKQFYFTTSEKFHSKNKVHDETKHSVSVSSGGSNSDNNLGSGGSPARETTEESDEESRSASIADTTRASEPPNETTNAVESSSPSDTTQASIENQSLETQDQSSEGSGNNGGVGAGNNGGGGAGNNGGDGTITEEQLLRELIQKIQKERANSTQPVITASTDSNCCGLNIYNDELMNINKCLEQHVDKTSQNGYEYHNDNWKSTQDRSCKNPPHILAKTTNCSGNNSVIGKFFPHIKTLHDIVVSTKAEGCPYRASLSYRQSDAEKTHLKLDSSNPLTDFQRMRQFQRNIDCRLAGLGNTLKRGVTSLARTKQPVRRCSGPGKDKGTNFFY